MNRFTSHFATSAVDPTQKSLPCIGKIYICSQLLSIQLWQAVDKIFQNGFKHFLSYCNFFQCEFIDSLKHET